MKNLFGILSACLIMHSLCAQKIIEKHFDFSGKKKIVMNFEIADSIRIIAWNKNEVYVKGSLDINHNKNNDAYDVNFDESGTEITMHSRFNHSYHGCCDDSTDCHCNCNCHEEIYFNVYVPENTDFNVETINGDITITGNTARIRAHSISGFIDLTLKPDIKADLRMNTISGTMYTNFDLTTQKKLRHVGGGSIDTMLNGGGEQAIDLETISGDIFLRKS